MSQIRRPHADEVPVCSTGETQVTRGTSRAADPQADSGSTVQMLEQLQAELADFLAETKSRLEQACEQNSTGYDRESQEPASLPGRRAGEPLDRRLADDSLDRLQEIKRRLAEQLQQR